jgi:hypothetical protein
MVVAVPISRAKHLILFSLIQTPSPAGRRLSYSLHTVQIRVVGPSSVRTEAAPSPLRPTS